MQQVASHLTGCRACQEELRRLERALVLAREVWAERAADAPAPTIRSVPSKISRLRAAAVLVASLALVSLTAAWWLAASNETQRGAVSRGTMGRSPSPLDETDVVEEIERGARIARLAASAELLAGNPSLREYREQADRYLEKAYGYRRPGG